MRGGQAPIETRGDFGKVITIASFLTLISGILNSVAFLEMGIPVTHHTGSALHVGRLMGTTTEFGSLAAGTAGASILLLVITYVLGAAVAGFSKCKGEAPYEGKVSWSLCGSAAMMAVGAALRHMHGAILPTLAIWSFSQGLQNAVTTAAAGFIGFPIRTTHVTGSATDLGTGLGQYVAAIQEKASPPSLRKPMVFAAGIAAFALGCFIGAVLHPMYGATAAFLPAGLLSYIALGRPGFRTPRADSKGSLLAYVPAAVDPIDALAIGAVLDYGPGLVQLLSSSAAVKGSISLSVAGIGVEAWPIFAAGVLSSLCAGISKDRIMRYATVWVILRALYIPMYFVQSTALSGLRTGVLVASLIVSLKQLQEAGFKFRPYTGIAWR